MSTYISEEEKLIKYLRQHENLVSVKNGKVIVVVFLTSFLIKIGVNVVKNTMMIMNY